MPTFRTLTASPGAPSFTLRPFESFAIRLRANDAEMSSRKPSSAACSASPATCFTSAAALSLRMRVFEAARDASSDDFPPL